MDDKIDLKNKDDKVLHSPEPEAVPVAPDGGYGWVVLCASFAINVLVDGVCFSFGIFYLEFLDYFGESKQRTSWVGSVLNGMYLSVGPIVSALANKYGCRKVSIAGSILATLAFSLSILSPNIDILILVYGGLGGIGFGLMYLPAIVMVGFYFEKKRALATGIAVCGSGIGTFIFAPLSNSLIRQYSWKGSTLIIGAIVLHGCCMGALFRPLKTTISKECQKEDMLDGENASNEDGAKNVEIHQYLLNGKAAHSKSLEHIHHKSNGEANLLNSVDQVWHMRKDVQEYLDVSRPMYRKDVFYSGSTLHLERQMSLDNIDNVEKSGEAITGRTSVFSTITQMMDFSLLLNPVFLIYGLSCFLCMAGFFVPFTFLPDAAQKLGIDGDSSAFLLSILGIANTIGRIGSGWVSDQIWADSLLINNCALLIGGVATMLIPFCNTYGLLAAYSSIFGLSIGAFVSLRSIIMVELMGLEQLTSAFGLVILFQGASSFIGAPIAGALFDATGNYDLSFYFAGSTIAMAGIICLPLRRLAKWWSMHRKSCDKDLIEKRQCSEIGI